jgi:hypothetical protein
VGNTLNCPQKEWLVRSILTQKKKGDRVLELDYSFAV